MRFNHIVILSFFFLASTTGSSAAANSAEVASLEIADEQTRGSGDINNDNKINIFDLLALLKHLQDTPSSAPQSADLDGSGVVDLSDLTALLVSLVFPMVPKTFALLGEPIIFPLKSDSHNDVFRMIVDAGSTDTLIVVVPPIENKSYNRFVRIDKVCFALNSAAYAAYRVKTRTWRPVIFTPALDLSTGKRSKMLMALPDSGVSVSLEPVEGNEELLENLGFSQYYRSCRWTRAKPDKSMDWTAFLDSLEKSGPQQAYALVKVQVKDPDQPETKGPQLSTQPPVGEVDAYIMENGKRPGPFDEYHLILDKYVAGDGTVYWRKTTEVRTGDSLTVIVSKNANYKTTLHFGLSETFIPEPNKSYMPLIFYFDQIYEVTPRIEKENEDERYLAWYPIFFASSYRITVYLGEEFEGRYQVKDPVKFHISDLNADIIFFHIRAFYQGVISGRIVSYAYETAIDSLYKLPYQGNRW